MNCVSLYTMGAKFLPRLAVLTVATGMSLLQTSCSRRDVATESRQPLKVQTMEVQLQRAPEVYEAAGTVRAKLTATVSAKIRAAIREIPVKAGDTVRAGDELAKLDNRDLRAEYDRARADYDRFKALLEKQAATPAEFEAVQSRYRVAEADLSYASITAPFDGVVGQKLCDIGDLAMPDKALFVVEQPTDFRLETQVPERLAALVGIGKSVHVLIDATGDKCDGIITEVNPSTDPATRSFLAKIDLKCQQPLRSGMFGRAQLLIGERTAVFLTKAAVRERGQLTSVFVAADGKARMRLVRTGREYLDLVEILSGLQPGEQVIVNAEGELSDGQPISR
jgi:membrane fusion protein, multidrug efflux system